MRGFFLFLCAVFMAASPAARAVECNVEHCTDCRYRDNYCWGCETGWFLSYDRKCHKMLDHCIEQYEDENSCDLCEDGYYKHAYDKKCYKMVEHCTEQAFRGQCSRCEEGWVLSTLYSDNTCYKKSVERCIRKTDLDERTEKTSGYKQCSACEVGYGVLPATEAVRRDQQCLPCADKNAGSCNPYNEVIYCKNGYELQSNQCYKKISDCVKYEGEVNTDGYCTECKDGYTPSADGKSCKKGNICPENAVCSDGNITCNSGYELKDGACVKSVCPANCSACSSSTACSACDSGYALSGTACVKAVSCRYPLKEAADYSGECAGCCTD